MKQSRLALLAVLLACCGPRSLLAEDAQKPQPPQQPKDAQAAPPPQTPAAPPAPAPGTPPTHVDLKVEEQEPPAVVCSFSAEYLLWWVKSATLQAPLVTTGPANAAMPGGLNDVNTLPVFSDRNLQFAPASGFRGEAALHVPEIGTTFTFGGFYLGEQKKNFAAASDLNGNPLLVRPFIDVQGAAFASAISVPGLFSGNVQISPFSHLWGLESNCIWAGTGCEQWFVSGLAGVRYLRLQEDLNISVNRTVLGGLTFFDDVALNPGDQVRIFDSFNTRSQFWGGQVGGIFEFHVWKLCLGLSGKLALGVSHNDSLVFGVTRGISPGNGIDLTLPGGVQALPSNSGKFSSDRVAVVPEINFSVSYDLSRNLRLTAGYDFLYWSSVARAAEQIPDRISSFQVPTSPFFGTPGQNVPAPGIRFSDLWVQGLHCGLEFRF